MSGSPSTDLALPRRAAAGTAPRARWWSGRATAIGLGVWGALIAAAWAWGRALNADGAAILLGAPPFAGRWDLQIAVELLIPIGLAIAIAVAAPIACRKLSWPWLLGAAGLAAAGWAIALALAEGPSGIDAPLERSGEYLPAVGMVGSPGELLSGFTERIGDYPTHVRSHPPGMLLALWSLEEIGLGGASPAALFVIAVAGSAVPAALIALRGLAGEPAARGTAPFLVLIPAAVWIATTADALYMGVGAWAVSLTLLGLTSTGGRSDLLALAGGVLFGAGLFLSYGLALLGAIPLAVAVARHRIRPLVVAAGGAALVALAFLAAGFWWLDGFLATREQYLESTAQTRPSDFFLLNNLAAFALALGPVAAIALARLRDRRVWLLVGGAVAGLLIADLSGMSKGEVERIWLPFVPWVLLAAAALPRAAGLVRALLGVQAACAIAIQVGVETIW